MGAREEGGVLRRDAGAGNTYSASVNGYCCGCASSSPPARSPRPPPRRRSHAPNDLRGPVMVAHGWPACLHPPLPGGVVRSRSGQRRHAWQTEVARAGLGSLHCPGRLWGAGKKCYGRRQPGFTAGAMSCMRSVGWVRCSAAQRGLAPKTVAGMVGRENGPGPGGCSHRQPACHH